MLPAHSFRSDRHDVSQRLDHHPLCHGRQRRFAAARAACVLLLCCASLARGAEPSDAQHFDVVVIGATPGGITAALSVARAGRRVALLERTDHVGGVVSNGLCKTDCFLPDAAGGLFREFRARIKQHYVDKFGADSPQVKTCRNGLNFEPSVAERAFREMIDGESERIALLTERQFDADPANTRFEGERLSEVGVLNRRTGEIERYAAQVFIDATYEGDLAAAARAPYWIGREGRDVYDEPTAGRLYQPWRGKPAPGSTGLGDNAIQAYNYRIILTRDPDDRVPIEKPANYNRADYASIIDDVKENRYAGRTAREVALNGLGRVVNAVAVPNGKYDGNNQHLAFVSTDLPEENWPWPTSDWAWRDRFAERLRDYDLGLLWFAQHDEELPADFREHCLEWGLSKSEFPDNGHFPRQVYVREGRRVAGEYIFTVHDALSKRGSREHARSVTAWQFNSDSHAVRKREPGRPHLEGFYAVSTRPCCVPYGTIVPQKVDGLLVPVAVSSSRVGYQILRMEPCWMSLGEAAGRAAVLSIEAGVPPREIDVEELQSRLLGGGAMLIYFKDVAIDNPHFAALQYFALRGFYGDNRMEAGLDERVSEATAAKWIAWSRTPAPAAYRAGKTTRGELLDALYAAVRALPDAERATVFAPAGADIGKD